jgi:serine protease Do
MHAHHQPAPARKFRAAPPTRILGAAVLGASLVLLPLAGQSGAEAQNLTQQTQNETQPLLPSLWPIVKKVLPAVVNVSVLEKSGHSPMGEEEESAPDDQDQGPDQGFPNSPFDEFLKRFFGPNGVPNIPGVPNDMGRRMALGSGFIIDPKGYVVTNNHVVNGAQNVTVVFQDNSKHPAKIIGRDEKTDLALLKIDTKEPLPYVTWGNSDEAHVGDWIMAVGNPFGLGGSVTAGIISALGRDIHSGNFDDFLQLDAPINRGNSGGPTFNQQGQVIGINTAIYSPSGGSVGIGFAIPSNLAKNIILQLEEHGKVTRGWLGVQIQQVSPDIASSLGLPDDHGALVADVTPNSPASEAGLKQGDVILKYNGKPVNKMRDLPLLVADTPPGKAAELTIWRSKASETVDIKVGELKNQQIAKAESPEEEGLENGAETASALGLKLAPLNEQTRRRLHVQKNVKGVVVSNVDPSGPSADLGIQPGDVIVSINQQPVQNPAEVAQKLKEAQRSGDKHLLLLLNRHGINEYVGISIG